MAKKKKAKKAKSKKSKTAKTKTVQAKSRKTEPSLQTVLGAIHALATHVNTLHEVVRAIKLYVKPGKTTETTETKSPPAPDLYDDQPPKSTNGESTYTKEQVMTALQEASTIHGIDRIKELVEKTGATRISEIDPLKYSQVIKEAQALNL